MSSQVIHHEDKKIPLKTTLPSLHYRHLFINQQLSKTKFSPTRFGILEFNHLPQVI